MPDTCRTNSGGDGFEGVDLYEACNTQDKRARVTNKKE